MAYINRCPQGKPQTFALSPGVAGSTSVLAYDFAVQIQEVAFRIASPCIPLQECGVITVWNKADVLTVPLPGGDQTGLFRNFPDLRFGKFSKREEDVRQLLLREGSKKIGLILAAILCFI